MNQYIGKICPYCKTAFTEEDEIVVCSDCEMPHHKDCWIANKGCTTFGCQGTIQGISFEEDTSISSAPKYEVREDPSDTSGPLICVQCGSPLEEGQAFCGKCGAPAGKRSVRAGAKELQGNAALFWKKLLKKAAAFLEKYATDTPIDSEMEDYIGTGKEYYTKAFSDMREKSDYKSWNWPAFLIAPFWMMYRKMYIPGAILTAVYLIMLMIRGFIPMLLLIAIAVAAGSFANHFYLYDLSKRIEKGKACPPEQKFQYTQKYGDVDTMIPSIVSVAFVLICALIIF